MTHINLNGFICFLLYFTQHNQHIWNRLTYLFVIYYSYVFNGLFYTRTRLLLGNLLNSFFSWASWFVIFIALCLILDSWCKASGDGRFSFTYEGKAPLNLWLYLVIVHVIQDSHMEWLILLSSLKKHNEVLNMDDVSGKYTSLLIFMFLV